MKLRKTITSIISLMLTAFILVGSFSMSAAAVVVPSDKINFVNSSDNLLSQSTSQIDVLHQYCDVDAFVESIRQQALGFGVINVSQYNVPADRDCVDAIMAIIQNRLIYEFNVDQTMGFSYSIDSKTNCVRNINVSYCYTQQEYEAAVTQCEAVADYLIGDLINSDLSDLEKILIVHDRIIAFCEYDLDTYSTDLSRSYDHGIDGVLLHRTSTCVGYAKTLTYLLAKLGIESRLVSSSEMSHAWNAVTLNGQDYLVDCTYDDPLPDYYGRVNHNYFMKSASYFYQHDHDAEDYETTATDTTYDSWYWDDVVTAFQYYKGSIYYLDNADACIYRKDASGDTNVLSLVTNWPALDYGPGYFYNGNFSSFTGDGRYLFYSEHNNVYSIDGENTSLVYSIEDGSRNIVGVYAYEGVLYMETSEGVYPDGYRIMTIEYPYITNYEITYNANGGEGAPEAQTKEKNESITISEVIPTWEGYTFTGWATSSDATASSVKPGDVYTDNDSLDLYAVWVKNECSISAQKVIKGSYLDWSIITTTDVDAVKFVTTYKLSDGTSKVITLSYGSNTTSQNVTVTDNGDARLWSVAQRFTYSGTDTCVKQSVTVSVRQGGVWQVYSSEPLQVAVYSTRTDMASESKAYTPFTLVSVSGPASVKSGSRASVTIVTTDDCSKVRIGYKTADGIIKYTTYQTTTASNVTYTDSNGLRTWTISYKALPSSDGTYYVNARGSAWGQGQSFTMSVI